MRIFQVDATPVYPPKVLKLIILLAETLLHLSLEVLKGVLGGEVLDLEFLQSLFSIVEGRGEVVALSLKLATESLEVSQATVGVTQSRLGLLQLI